MMDIKISRLWFTQKVLKRKDSIPHLMKIKDLDPVKLQYCELDDEIEIINGHHRVTAIYLSGKSVLRPHQYILSYSTTPKRRFGHVEQYV